MLALAGQADLTCMPCESGSYNTYGGLATCTSCDPNMQMDTGTGCEILPGVEDVNIVITMIQTRGDGTDLESFKDLLSEKNFVNAASRVAQGTW